MTNEVIPSVSGTHVMDYVPSYNQKLWMLDLLKVATYPPS